MASIFRLTHPFTRGSTLACLGVLVAHCGPSQEAFDAETNRANRLESELQSAKQQQAELDARHTALLSTNDELASRLEALGQNVEALKGDRAELADRLEETKRALEALREREQQAQARLATFKNLLKRFQSMIESGKLRVRIVRNRMVVELPEGILFASGDATLKRTGHDTLTEVAKVLASLDGRNFQVAGHTDNLPIRTARFPSNWDLSTSRAVNVTHFLIAQGVAPNRISAAGYADTEPVASNDTAEGRQQNRRIEIVLLPNLDELPDLSSLETDT